MAPRYSIIPGPAPYDKRLTDFDIRVLTCIGRHTDKGGWCWLKQTKMAEALGKSREAVNKAIAKLVKFKYLEKVDVRSPVTAKKHGVKREDWCYYRVIMDGAPAPIGEDVDCGIDVPPAGFNEAEMQEGCDRRITTNEIVGSQRVVIAGSQQERPPLNAPQKNDQGESALRNAASTREARAAGNRKADPTIAGFKNGKGRKQGGLFDKSEAPPADEPGVQFTAAEVDQCLRLLLDAMDFSPASSTKPRRLKMRQLLTTASWEELSGIEYVRQLAHELKIAEFPRSDKCKKRPKIDEILDDRDDIQAKFLEGNYRYLHEEFERSATDEPGGIGRADYTAEFERFWAECPQEARAGSKPLAFQEWEALDEDDRFDVLRVVPHWVAEDELTPPHAAKWLKLRYWEALAENEGIAIGFPVPPDPGPERREWLHSWFDEDSGWADAHVIGQVRKCADREFDLNLLTAQEIPFLRGLVVILLGAPGFGDNIVCGGLSMLAIKRRVPRAFDCVMHNLRCVIDSGYSPHTWQALANEWDRLIEEQQRPAESPKKRKREKVTA